MATFRKGNKGIKYKFIREWPTWSYFCGLTRFNLRTITVQHLFNCLLFDINIASYHGGSMLLRNISTIDGLITFLEKSWTILLKSYSDTII